MHNLIDAILAMCTVLRRVARDERYFDIDFVVWRFMAKLLKKLIPGPDARVAEHHLTYLRVRLNAE